MKEPTARYDEDLDHSIWEDILDFAKIFLGLGLTILILSVFVVKPVMVSGRSMYPTFESGERGATNILGLTINGLHRFDIVTARVTGQEGETETVIKRVIALPGETVECRDGKVCIDGKRLKEKYLDTEYRHKFESRYGFFTADFEPVTLAEDEYFLMGDNRPVSLDSRDFGPVESGRITARGFITFFPLEKFGRQTDFF